MYHTTLVLPGLATAVSVVILLLDCVFAVYRSRLTTSSKASSETDIETSCGTVLVQRLGGFTITAFKIARLSCILTLFCLSGFTTLLQPGKGTNSPEPLKYAIGQLTICVTYVSSDLHTSALEP